MKHGRRTAVLSVIAATATLAQPFPIPGVVPTTPTPLNETAEKAVIIRDPAVLSATNLGLENVLRSIVASSGVGSRTALTTGPTVMMQSMITSFAAASFVNNGITMPVTARPGEAALLPADLLNPTHPVDGMRLTAIVNRFDLALADFSTCGEARLVYTKGDPLNVNGSNRLTMIFEAAIPNPTPALGSVGCLPITQFWAGLTTQSGAQLASSLTAFFLQGVPPMKPVVHVDNYGHPFGQVRVNLFDNSQPFSSFIWQLREFSVDRFSAPGIRVAGTKFTPKPVADSAWAVLYQRPVPGEAPELSALRQDFWAYETSTRIPQLAALDLAAPTSSTQLTDTRLITGLGSMVPTRFCGFESSATIVGPLPAILVADGLVSSIDTVRSTMPLPWRVETTQFLNRDGAVACGGCHEAAANVSLAPASGLPGGEILFPRPVEPGFVHINEQGAISPYLRDRALPRRAEILQNFNAAGGVVTAPTLSAALPQPADEAQLEVVRENARLRGSAFGGHSVH